MHENRVHGFRFRAAVLYSLGAVVSLMGTSDDLFACHKIHHDCQAEIGPPNIRELPFRIARNRGFFDNVRVNPEIVSATSDEALAALAKGQSLITVASLKDAAEVLKGPDIRIIAVLQQESDSFLALKSESRDRKAATTAEHDSN